jgi:hypothetical protein
MCLKLPWKENIKAKVCAKFKSALKIYLLLVKKSRYVTMDLKKHSTYEYSNFTV